MSSIIPRHSHGETEELPGPATAVGAIVARTAWLLVPIFAQARVVSMSQ